ncbi:MAG TPA: hypothetical protein VHI71_10115 [Actinomycetota bacterium]|nr:hypothetical protein [Actinomycetota bacterium]
MRKTLVAIVAGVALVAHAPSPASEPDDPESCLAMNPAQPECTVTITSDSTSGVVTGAVGAGDWIVVVKRGRQKLTIEPSSAQPEPVQFEYEVGDKVKATVKSAGGWVLAGHD